MNTICHLNFEIPYRRMNTPLQFWSRDMDEGDTYINETSRLEQTKDAATNLFT